MGELELINLEGLNYKEEEIKEIQEEDCFTVDIEVDTNHHYILDNGIISHNTISLLTEYTSGIEPLFSKAYIRRDRVSERVYIHQKYFEFLTNGQEIPEWFVDSFDIQPKDHLEIQQTVQKHVDAAVSKTINLPFETTVENLDSLLLESVKDLKGVTVYRNGCRDGQPLNPMTKEEIVKYLVDNKKVENNFNESDVKCSTGKCEI